MSRPWMPLYVADYLADTRRLSTLEHGAYMLLIMDYWRNGSLPNDDRKLARIVGLSEAEWMDIRETIADLFEDGWKHKRIEHELAEAASAYDRRAEAGRKSGERRAAKAAVSNVPTMLEHCSNNDPSLLKQSQPQSPSEDSSNEESLSAAEQVPPPAKAKPKGERGTRLPDDWRPTGETRQFAIDELGYDRAAAEFEKFRDYWRAKAGREAVKLDWDATWRNWVRTARERAPPKAREGPADRFAFTPTA